MVVRLVIYSDQQLMKEWEMAKTEVVIVTKITSNRIITIIIISSTIIITIIITITITISRSSGADRTGGPAPVEVSCNSALFIIG